MKKIIIANWKMNPETLEQARQMFSSIEHRMHMHHQVTEVVVCPPFVYLPPLFHHSHMVKLGAQNMGWAESGAYTGEISPLHLGKWGAEYVILGHSERRLNFGETDAAVNLKIAAALKHKIHPVVCLGGEPGAKKTGMKRLVTKQLNAAVKGLSDAQISKILFVYEPIWAISTMKNSEPATGEHASEMVEHIRKLLAKYVGKEHAKHMKVLYGGTVNKANVNEFARYPSISGALVGAASLDPDNFLEIVKEFTRESIHKA